MKNLNYKNYIWIIIIMSALIWWIIAKIKGVDLSNLWILLKQTPDVVSMNLLLFAVFARWGWKWRAFQGWLVPFPNLNGSWQGSIKTTWKNPETNKVPEPISVLLTIKQSFLGLSCIMRTSEMTSYSYAEDFRIDNDKQIKQLIFTYLSKPQVSVTDRSPIHEGTIIFDIIESPLKKLSGQYWTSRKTTGEINLTFRENQLLDHLPADFPPHPMTNK